MLQQHLLNFFHYYHKYIKFIKLYRVIKLKYVKFLLGYFSREHFSNTKLFKTLYYSHNIETIYNNSLTIYVYLFHSREVCKLYVILKTNNLPYNYS